MGSYKWGQVLLFAILGNGKTRPLLRGGNCSRPHWIQYNVSAQLKKVAFLFYEEGFVTALEGLSYLIVE